MKMTSHSPRRSPKYALRALLILLPITAALLWTTPAFLSSINNRGSGKTVGASNDSKPAHKRAPLAVTNVLSSLPAPVPLPTVGPGVAPDGDPGGFGIEGDLRSNFPGADRSSDWVANPSPTPSGSPVGDYMLNNDGTARLVFPANGNGNITKHFTDGVGGADQDIFQSTGDKYNDNPTTWDWAVGKPPQKNDINHALLHQALDSAGNAWIIVAGYQGSSQGDRYIDFELLQKPIAKTCATPACTSGNFSSTGPDAGRTVGDLLLTVQLSNGGAAAQFFVYRWQASAASTIGFDYIAEPTTAGNVFIAANTGGAVAVPYTAFGTNSYPLNTFAEAAVNLNALLANFGFNPCIGIKTLFIKTKTSTSPSAQLKDFIDPIGLEFGSAPSSTITAADVCAGFTGNTASVTDAGPGSTYNWTVTNGTVTAGSGTNQITYTAGSSGTVQLSVTVNNKAGCGSTTSPPKSVTINPKPDATITATAACASSTGTASVPDAGAGANYAWSISNGTITSGSGTRQIGYTASGSSQVNLGITVTASTGCSATSTLGVTPNGKPTVTVNSPSGRAGATVTMTATPAGGTGPYSYAWTVPSGVSNPGNVASFSASVAGTYSVIVTDSKSCASASGAGTLTINPKPTVTVNSPTSCAGSLPATMTATPAGGSGPYHYAWTVPAGASAPGDVASFGTSTAGTYSVIVTDANSCASASGAGTLTVHQNPTVTVNSPTSCAGSLPATMTATPAGGSGPYHYAWTVPAGASAPGDVASFSTSTAGTYSVIVTDANSCSSASGAGTLTVNANPTVTVNSPTVCGSGLPTTITATPAGGSGPYHYAWTVPAGASAPGDVASFNTSTAGTYSVIVSDAKSCASASGAGTLTVNQNPTLTVNSPTSCAGSLPATMTATPAGGSGPYHYAWTIPAGASAPGDVASFSTSTAGTYSVIVTDANSCSSASGAGTLTVHQNPTVTVNSPTSCAGSLPATMTATPVGGSGPYQYAWPIPAGASAPGDVATF